jgi:cobalt/nickel transport protein
MKKAIGSKKIQNWLLISGVVGLTLLPLLIVKDGKFGGADEQGQAAITAIQPDYKPWFQSIFQPASAEIASLLFATQAALGAGTIGYVIGLYKGRAQAKQSQGAELSGVTVEVKRDRQ